MVFKSSSVSTAVSLTFLIFFCFHVSAFSQDAKITALNQAIQQWFQNPDDKDLGKIVAKQAKVLKGREKPEDYNRHMEKGHMAFKDAKSPEDFKEVAAEFQSATTSAPWLGDGWYNLGKAKEKAGDYTDAENDLKLYLILSPKAKDIESIKKSIYDLEYEADKAKKESNPAALTPTLVGQWKVVASNTTNLGLLMNVVRFNEGYQLTNSFGTITFTGSPTQINGVFTPTLDQLIAEYKPTSDLPGWQTGLSQLVGKISYRMRITLSADGQSAVYEQDAYTLSIYNDGRVAQCDLRPYLNQDTWARNTIPVAEQGK